MASCHRMALAIVIVCALVADVAAAEPEKCSRFLPSIGKTAEVECPKANAKTPAEPAAAPAPVAPQPEPTPQTAMPPPTPRAAPPPASPPPAPSSASSQAGTRFKDCDRCPEMVVVPAGSFAMGAPAEDESLVAVQGQKRTVTIAKPFAVGKFEVSRDEFEAFITATGHQPGDTCGTNEGDEVKFRNPGYTQAGTHPVVCVGWDDAKAYAAWLSRTSGKSYRLLTEAEWEYAARAGTTTRYSFGDDNRDICGFANGKSSTCEDAFKQTAPAGSFKPNAFGLYDMHGNVWEWVEDCYQESYHGAPTDGSAVTTGDCSSRVVRGGSWWDYPGLLGSAFRSWSSTANRINSYGFRVGRTL